MNSTTFMLLAVVLSAVIVLVLAFAVPFIKSLLRGGGKPMSFGESKARQLNDEEEDRVKHKVLGPQCPHPKFEGDCTCTVKGKEMKMSSRGPCAECLEAYLNQYSTLCAACEEPILPGENVAKASVGSPHPYTHMYMNCCPCGALYCGKWGEGELIGLPGGGCMLDAAMATGKPVIGNLDDDGNMKIEVLGDPSLKDKENDR